MKELSPIRWWDRFPDCQVAVPPPDTVPEPSSATTVVESKTKQRHDVTTLTPSVCILSPAGQLEPGDRERATQTQRRLEADRGNGRNILAD